MLIALNEHVFFSFFLCFPSVLQLNPLAQDLVSGLPKEEQTNFRAVVTDSMLRVKGSQGSIFALGDASTIDNPKVSVPVCVYTPSIKKEAVRFSEDLFTCLSLFLSQTF